MHNFKKKLYPRSVKGKILAAFLLIIVAIVLAISIARFSFQKMMTTIGQLSEPNRKLALLNRTFEEITTLDQVQRAEAVRNPRKPFQTFLDQSETLTSLIDSLSLFDWDSGQRLRLSSMKTILDERNKLFFSYLKVKADLLDNREFSAQLDSLTAILQDERNAIDSSVITTETKTITTYIPDSTRVNMAEDDEERSTLLKKLFGRRKSKKETIIPLIKKVEEQLRIKVDTLAIARQNDGLLEIERLMRELENDQQAQRKQLQNRELELIQANTLFISQLLNILHDVEREELLIMDNRNHHAARVVSDSITRMYVILISFFLGAALLVLFIWMDISKSNYYKEQLEQEKERAEALSQIKQRFLANMSHEIRTPLQSIIGFAEQLGRQNGKHEEAIDAIRSSSEHLLQIVNEVLDYSRISSGHFTLAHDEFPLLKQVREVESAIRVQAERKNLTFILDLEQATEYVLIGDPFRLRQILYNLLGNAVKFTHNGFVKLSVKTIESEQRVRCSFEVTDTGIGIASSDMEKIFNQFEQGNSKITHQYGGAGLGLTIVKSLVEAQKGTLNISSEPGKGSTFRVELEFEKASSSEPVSTPNAETLVIDAADKHVILVDDDRLILRLCSMILQKHNIRHRVYTDPSSLLENPPDPSITHLFLDIRMPDINGIDLCRALKQKYDKQARFIALTAHVLPEERESLLREGFDAVLPKPFHERQLLQVLGNNTIQQDDNAPVPDLQALHKMTCGDESLFQSIITQFIEDTTADLAALKDSLKHPQPDVLRDIVHKMAGRLGQVGMTDISAQLREMEKKLMAGRSASSLVPGLSTLANTIATMLTQIRKTRLEHLN